MGSLEGVVAHELGHALGIGTLWELHGRDLVQPNCVPFIHNAPRFVGPGATDAHEAAGGSGGPHVETHGGVGTACAHWDEDRYGSELMSSFFVLGEEMRLSAMTIRSLADLGYQVDPSAADPYVVPTEAPLAPQHHDTIPFSDVVGPAPTVGPHPAAPSE
jgi:hypothetical protein